MYIYGTHQRNKYILGSMAVVVSFVIVDDNYSFDHDRAIINASFIAFAVSACVRDSVAFSVRSIELDFIWKVTVKVISSSDFEMICSIEFALWSDASVGEKLLHIHSFLCLKQHASNQWDCRWINCSDTRTKWPIKDRTCTQKDARYVFFFPFVTRIRRVDRNWSFILCIVAVSCLLAIVV